MNNMLRHILIKMGIVELYRSLMQIYYNFASTRVECSVGDILLQRDVIQNNQFLLTSRLLDVEAYVSGKDKTFPFQNAISYKAYGINHNKELGDQRFQSLIESYLKDGYHSDSYVTCDRDMNLMDGNHRMGIHVYESIETIMVRRVKRTIPFPYGTDAYYEAELPTDFIEIVKKRFGDIQGWLIEKGMTFSAFLKVKDSVSFIKDMKGLCNVLNVLSNGSGEGIVVQFSMPCPNYKISGGELVSMRAIAIERILRKRAQEGEIIKVGKNCMEGQRIINNYVGKEEEQ